MKRSRYNPKRRIAAVEDWPEAKRRQFAQRVRYGGNSEHKSRPNDYGLTPPTNPRPGKTLCDKIRDFLKAEATELVRLGILKGMFSVQEREGWPQNVWSVFEGEPFESQLENREQGVYHGYPMTAEDDFRNVILKEWARRE